jgi:hypothetical protein
VARVVAFIPDLLFGSNVVGALRAAGHEVALVSEPGADAPGEPADVLIVDLTADSAERIAQVSGLEQPPARRTLAFYSHVEADVRAAAQAAGFDLVVPRSRMSREGAELVTRLAAESAQ